MGQFSFQMNVQFTAASYLEMFFGTKQNPRYALACEFLNESLTGMCIGWGCATPPSPLP